MIIEKKQFCQRYINEINNANFDLSTTYNGIQLFGSITNLKTDLKNYFFERLQEQVFIDRINVEFQQEKYIKTKIKEIANRNLVYKTDLESFFDINLQKSLTDDLDKNEFISNIIEFIESKIIEKSKFRYTKNSVKKILEKQFDFIFSKGFPTNILNINSGVMTANAGDSAQFLFLARAILAGFNCSNVDVRSSRYDAVIDFNNTLLRIQIKGVSGNNSISFKDRDRGGQGIDHHHERNRGQRITSNDCDIYVAVDKEVGICYLIPMSQIDSRPFEEIVNVNLSELEDYKENWNVIKIVAENK